MKIAVHADEYFATLHQESGIEVAIVKSFRSPIKDVPNPNQRRAFVLRESRGLKRITVQDRYDLLQTHPFPRRMIAEKFVSVLSNNFVDVRCETHLRNLEVILSPCFSLPDALLCKRRGLPQDEEEGVALLGAAQRKRMEGKRRHAIREP